MKAITVSNYHENKDLINSIVDQNPQMQQMNELVEKHGIEKLHKGSDKLKDGINKYVAELNKITAKQQQVKKEKPEKPKPAEDEKPKPKKSKAKVRAKKAEKEPVQKERHGTHHRKLPVELTYIRRFVAMDGKTVEKNAIKSFLAKIESDNAKDLFSVKKGNFGREIQHIHKELTRIAQGNAGSSFVFKLDNTDKKLLNKFTVALEQNKQCPAVRLVVRFNNLYKNPTKEKAQRLLKTLTNAEKKGAVQAQDEFAPDVAKIKTALKAYINKGGELKLPESDLRGLAGIASCTKGKNTPKKDGLGALPIIPMATTTAAIVTAHEIRDWRKNAQEKRKRNANEVISSENLRTMSFETIKLDSPFKELIGDPAHNFAMLVHGPPEHGKSSFAIMFAHHLAKLHGNVLFIGKEEKLGYTLQEKFQRFNAFHPALDIAEDIPSNLDKYQFVFIDSITRAGMSNNDVVALLEKYPNKAFVFISHSTKKGEHRGSQSLKHEVDVTVTVEKGVAIASGRFAPRGEMKVLEWETAKADQPADITNDEENETVL